MNNSEEEYKKIPLDMLKEPVDQERTVIELEGLEELADSIQKQGIIEPLIVMKSEDKYEIIAGHRRYLAAKMSGLILVPCIIRSIANASIDMIKLHENAFRENINPVDEGRFLQRVKDRNNLTVHELARISCRSETYILNRLNLLSGDEVVLAALEGNRINFSQAVLLNKTENEKIRHELLRITIENGATVETLRIMKFEFEQRMGGPFQSSEQNTGGGVGYLENKHLIECPCCRGSYSVNKIYPISLCKGCYDGFVNGLKG